MKLPQYWLTLLLAAAVTYFTALSHYGFLLSFLLPVLIIYFLAGVIALIRRPAERRQRTIRMAIWLAVVVVSTAAQVHWATAARSEADAVARAVGAYKSRTGNYPQALAELQIDGDELAEQWMLSYRLVDGKPQLAYASTAIPLDSYVFDFDKGTWTQDSY